MTSSVQPPVLNPSLGTPSGEWANKTASSLDQPSQGTPLDTTSGQVTSQSPGVTPGSELPGAFPDRDQGEPSTGTTNITETIVDTARQYLPAGVVNTVQNYLGKPHLRSTRANPPTSHVLLQETTLLEPLDRTRGSGLQSMTSTTKPRSLHKNCAEPCLMNTSGVWGLSPGLPSRKA